MCPPRHILKMKVYIKKTDHLFHVESYPIRVCSGINEETVVEDEYVDVTRIWILGFEIRIYRKRLYK